ncbi:hypothetical protein JHK86_002629 [Glycine max]|nr:hypothetical protein JHK86_002629 [Glycine max]
MFPMINDIYNHYEFDRTVLNKTLVELKLRGLHVKTPFSSVHLTSLQILHLEAVIFSEYRLLGELLFGYPNLEDLTITLPHFLSNKIEPEFKQLPKLVRAVIDKHDFPLEFVNSVQFLRINWMDDGGEGIESWIPEFHNLSHIELHYVDFTDENRLQVSQTSKSCH